MYIHQKQIVNAGVPIAQAKKALIMLHGRGASANGIISLKNYLQLEDTAIFIPEASQRSWYPYSFMAPVQDNEPALSSALEIIDELVQEILDQHIPLDKIYFWGFSQGACLSLEYVARHASRYGGVMAFTGGLIGEKLNESIYQGDFVGTPVLLTTGDPDPHVPLSRVEETQRVLGKLQAKVLLKVFKGRPHSILPDELELANEHVLNGLQ